ncbi:hypothetical protein [Rhodoferax ferrireducens]|uniref:hypothetical protein n=1 Tax=Rhodoferax ferrireducens TaxID=192843 RepID=UPI0013004E64|nr:hypothetical protein [Rhodoferax ferrireducens]
MAGRDGRHRLTVAPVTARPEYHAELCSFLDRCPLRVAGTCDTTAPPQRQLSGGAEILCHRSEADLLALQTRRAETASA